MDFLEELNKSSEHGAIPQEIKDNLLEFYNSYTLAIKGKNGHKTGCDRLMCQFLRLVEKQLKDPYAFQPFHRKVTEPFDYYQFCLDFFRPLIIFEKSTVIGDKHLNDIDAYLSHGDNIVFFANHQTEPDPQAISFLLEKSHEHIAKEMIFVAGHRVTTDPLAVPFSLGRNLLCIYSKKHIEHAPDKKVERMRQNQRTMQVMKELLTEGGKCIYVAPSGGRDRADRAGHIKVAEFDPQNIEMFRLIVEQSKSRTHFYPLSLSTYNLLPPPSGVEKKLGELRHTQSTPIHLAVGHKIEMDDFPGSEGLNKKEKRVARANYIYGIVKENYEKLT